MDLAVLGAGAWGSAASLLLTSSKNKNHKIRIWDYDPGVVDLINKRKENTVYLPGFKMPKSIKGVKTVEEAIDEAEVIISAVPTIGLKYVSEKCAKNVSRKTRALVSLTKGYDLLLKKRPSEIWLSVCPSLSKKFAVLSGPSHAEEVAGKKITAVSVASRDIELARFIAKMFSNEQFRCYSSDDIAGVEIGGALKNVMAIGAGIIDGLKLGNNCRSSYITRALYEMMRFGRAFLARRETFMGLSGMGDLIVTCTSGLSRNYHVGKELARGKKIEDISKKMVHVAEGIKTSKIVAEIAGKKKIEMPIATVIRDIVYDKKNAGDGIRELMSRSLKDEIVL